MGVCISDYENSDLNFRCSFWNWRPIIPLICSFDLITDDDKEIFQECHGGLELSEARALGTYLREVYLESMKDGSWMDLDGKISTTADDGYFHRTEVDVDKNYKTPTKVLEQFVNFLDVCNGFCVY